MGPYRAPAIDLLKDPADRRGFSMFGGWDVMDPRQMRSDEVEDRCSLLAPENRVESRAGDSLLDVRMISTSSAC